MMYSFMTLADNTEVVHSQMLEDGTVKVYFERPDEKDCFHNACCYLPKYEWTEINGFSTNEIQNFQKYLESVAHLIIEFSQKGGFDSAAGF